MFCSQLTHLMLSVLIVCTANVSAQELSSTLHTTISGILVAYDGEVVTFTCVTRNSQTLAWSSNDYIGTGGTRLELIAAESPGTSRRASTGLANATLTNVNQSMTTVLVSELLVRVVSTYQSSSVTCHSVGTDKSNTTTFYMADVTSLTCNQLSVCPTEPVTCTCVTGYSMMHSWISDEYIGRNNQLDFTSSTSVGTRRNATALNTFAVLVNISNENDVFVITSNLTVATVRSDRPVVLTCVNIDRQNSTVILPIADKCRGRPGDQVLTTAPANGGATSTSDTSYIAPLIIVIILMVSLVVVVIISVLLFWREKRKLKQEFTQAKYELKKEFEEEKEKELKRKDEECKKEKEILQDELTSKFNEEKEKELLQKDEEFKEVKITIKREMKQQFEAEKRTLRSEMKQQCEEEKRALLNEMKQQCEVEKKSLKHKLERQHQQEVQKLNETIEAMRVYVPPNGGQHYQ